MEYKTSLDTLAKIITIGIVILFIVIGHQSVKSLLVAKGDSSILLIHAGVLLLLVAIILGSWLYAPQSYTIDKTDLTINRPIGKVKISLADISQVRSVSDTEMRGTIRTFGVGGLFGYFGKYYTPGLGHTTFYATQRTNKILIEDKKGKKFILTPDDIGLIDKIKKHTFTNSIIDRTNLP